MSIPFEHFSSDENDSPSSASDSQPILASEPSTLTAAELENVTQLLGPAAAADYLIVAADPDQRPDDLLEPSMAFWAAQIDAGLRFPVCPFLRGVCLAFKIPINQITPSSIRIAISFFIILSKSGGRPSPPLFQACYSMKKIKGFYYFASKPTGPAHFLKKPCSAAADPAHWKCKYFIVTPKMGKWEFEWQKWQYSTPVYPRISIDEIPVKDDKLMRELSEKQEGGIHEIANMVRSHKRLVRYGFACDEYEDMGWEAALQYPAEDDVVTVTPDNDEEEAIFSGSVSGKATPTIEEVVPPQVKEMNTGRRGDCSEPRSSYKRFKNSEEQTKSRKNCEGRKSSKPSSGPLKTSFEAGKGSENRKGYDPRKGKDKINECAMALSEMNLNESFQFISLPTPRDIAACENYDDQKMIGSACAKLSQLISIFGQVAMRSNPANKSQLQNELQQKGKEVLKLNLEVKDLKQENFEFERRLAQAEKEIQLMREANDLSYANGTRDCCEKILLTPVGQNFLRYMKEDLITAYCHSPAYLQDIGSFAYHIAAFGFDQAVLGFSQQDFRGNLNKTKLLKAALPSMPLPEPLSNIPKLPDNYPWWIETMKRAARELAFSPALASNLAYSMEPEFPVLDERLSVDIGSDEEVE